MASTIINIIMKRYRTKPKEVEAIQFTKEMQKNLVSLGKNPNENPIDVELPFMIDAHTYWNWYTTQLYVVNKELGDFEINVGDWIIKDLTKKKNNYDIRNPKDFKKDYELIEI